MKHRKPTRRALVLGTGAALLLPSARVMSAAPPAQGVTPDLLAAARKEGKLSWYTSVDLPVAERLGKAFEAKYPGVSVRVERSGAERIYQRLGQEYGSRIYACDIAHSSDAAHFIIWKRDGWLAPFVSDDMAAHYPAAQRDADGMYATWRIFLSVIAYNTKLVKAEDAPKGFIDLLDPKWAGKIVKAHPGYSGTIMTATQQIARDLGWSYLEKLSKQRVMQVQSAADPPKKLALGERAIMADGGDYVIFGLIERGEPVMPVYAVEGTPLITGPSGVMKNAPNPNAARLFQIWSFSAEAQQLNIDVGGLRSAHAQTREPANRKALAEIKTMKEDAAAVAAQAEEIKTKYTQLFKV